MEFKPFQSFPQFKGVSVGKCIATRQPLDKDDMAHSHDSPNDQHRGWICVNEKQNIYSKNGGASNVMKHELAHIVTDHGHDKIFKKVLNKIGGTPSYMGNGKK